jgi:transcriptional regulator with XRE-family HTH domain
MTASTWGKWVSAELAARDWDVSDVARLTGVPVDVLSQWISQDVQPSVTDLRKFATALDIPMLHAMVAAGYLTAEEAGLIGPALQRFSIDLRRGVINNHGGEEHR